MWPKGPIQIVVWVAEGIRGYEVVSKHSKCSHTCDFPLREPPPLNQKMLVGKFPKPSIFAKGRIAYG